VGMVPGSARNWIEINGINKPEWNKKNETNKNETFTNKKLY